MRLFANGIRVARHDVDDARRTKATRATSLFLTSRCHPFLSLGVARSWTFGASRLNAPPQHFLQTVLAAALVGECLCTQKAGNTRACPHLPQKSDGEQDGEYPHSAEPRQVERPSPRPIHQQRRDERHEDVDRSGSYGSVLRLGERQTCRPEDVGRVVYNLQIVMSEKYCSFAGFAVPKVLNWVREICEVHSAK